MKKRKYDTAIVMLYVLGKEELLPPSFRQQIPYSTISTWRREDYGNYVGHEFRFLFEESWDLLSYQEESKKLKKVLQASICACLSLRSTFLLVILQAKKDKTIQKQLLQAINCLRSVLPLKQILKLIGLSRPLYQEWNTVARYNCESSFGSLFLKRYPNQL